jgi:hypothetical protein
LGGKRLIPNEKVLEDAYRRALAIAIINDAIKDARELGIKAAKAATIPHDLRGRVERALADSPLAWDAVLYDIVEQKFVEVNPQ